MNSTGSRLAVISGHLGTAPYLDFVKENHRRYCARHGYDYHFYSPDRWEGFSTDNPIVDFGWVKVAAARNFLSGYESVFWIDSDSIFSKESKSLDDLTATTRDLVITGDTWDVFNTGHFLLRSGWFSEHFLDTWWSLRGIVFEQMQTSHQDSMGRLNEQPIANALLRTGISPEFKTIVARLPDAFNQINGFIGNTERLHKDFHLRYAPNRQRNIGRTSSLIAKDMQAHIQIVPQARLNGYTARQKGELLPTAFRSEILHYAGDKSALMKKARIFQSS